MYRKFLFPTLPTLPTASLHPGQGICGARESSRGVQGQVQGRGNWWEFPRTHRLPDGGKGLPEGAGLRVPGANLGTGVI